MSDWNPALYTRFEDERTRPAAELLARVPLAEVRTVVDLGCGPGNSTALLAERWPAARVVGIDSSPAMLDAARKRLPGCTFEQADIADWQPASAVDLVYANAALQWVPDHARLLPRLMDTLSPGGVLAVQMPDNLDEPSHRLMRETASEPRYAAFTGPAEAVRTRILSAGEYHDLLSPHAAAVDIWRTTYHHRMADPAAIVEWLRATGLRPFLDALPGAAEQAAFVADYERRIDAAYPRRADGGRLLAFPRLFLIAVKR